MNMSCFLQSSLNGRGKNGSISFGSTEKKLLVISIYFEFLAGITLLIFTLKVIFGDAVGRSIRDYFIVCEQRGHDPENPCSHYEINCFAWVSAMSYIINAAFPRGWVKEMCSGNKEKQPRQQS